MYLAHELSAAKKGFDLEFTRIQHIVTEILSHDAKVKEEFNLRQAELDQKEANLARQKEELLKQASFVASCSKSLEIVSVNVGGELVQTSVSTLCTVPGSMLSALFSGKHTVAKDKHGNFFLDRDPDVFKHVLHYLRTGTLQSQYSDDLVLRNLVADEFDFFCIPLPEMYHRPFTLSRGITPQKNNFIPTSADIVNVACSLGSNHYIIQKKTSVEVWNLDTMNCHVIDCTYFTDLSEGEFCPAPNDTLYGCASVLGKYVICGWNLWDLKKISEIPTNFSQVDYHCHCEGSSIIFISKTEDDAGDSEVHAVNGTNGEIVLTTRSGVAMYVGPTKIMTDSKVWDITTKEIVTKFNLEDVTLCVYPIFITHGRDVSVHSGPPDFLKRFSFCDIPGNASAKIRYSFKFVGIECSPCRITVIKVGEIPTIVGTVPIPEDTEVWECSGDYLVARRPQRIEIISLKNMEYQLEKN